jgi:hypothetical protein
MGARLELVGLTGRKATAGFARQLQSSGVVDWFQSWDQLVSFPLQALWRYHGTTTPP